MNYTTSSTTMQNKCLEILTYDPDLCINVCKAVILTFLWNLVNEWYI